MRLIPLRNSEVSTTPSSELPRLAIATAIPREVDGAAAVRERSEARMKARENLKYILSRTIKRFVDAHLWIGKPFFNNYEPTEILGTLLGFYIRHSR